MVSRKAIESPLNEVGINRGNLSGQMTRLSTVRFCKERRYLNNKNKNWKSQALAFQSYQALHGLNIDESTSQQQPDHLRSEENEYNTIHYYNKVGNKTYHFIRTDSCRVLDITNCPNGSIDENRDSLLNAESHHTFTTTAERKI